MPLLNHPHLRLRHEFFHVDRILKPESDRPPKRKHRVIAVMPAYNAERTLAATLADMPAGCVDEVILVDDGSTDRTVEVARDMGLTVIVHPENRGYGGNQKTCYREALERGADIVVMIHPDYQYDSRVIPLRRRLHRAGHLRRGAGQPHPLARRGAARRHAGLQVSRKPLFDVRRRTSRWARTSATSTAASASTAARCWRRIPFERNSDDFVFDTQFLVQAVHFGFRLGDVPVPVRYFDEASSINFRRSLVYGLRTLGEVGRYWLHRLRVRRSRLLTAR